VETTVTGGDSSGGVRVLLGVALLLAGCPRSPPAQPPDSAPVKSATTAEKPPLPKAAACASSAECPAGSRCSTEQGACDRPPGCGPEDICPQVCYGTCGPAPAAQGPKGGCQSAADCRTFSDYCTGCDCRALGVDDPDPVCDGPGVRCVADPCMNRQAICTGGGCVITSK
jgi:hypothetical protein